MVFVLGGHQSDFSTNWSRQGDDLFALMKDSVQNALENAQVEASDVGSAHIGNFVGELFSGQGHLGGLFATIDPAFEGIPTNRHEAACASGGAAILSAMAEIEAGYHDLVCVVGVEQMRNIPGAQAAEFLGAAAWRGREGQDATYLWPNMFSQLIEYYDQTWGLDHKYLQAIAQKNFGNAKRNPNAQTRKWEFTDKSFTSHDEANPVVEGRVRRQDCSQITDGAACVLLASPRFAEAWAKKRGMSMDDIARISGWGHRTATMLQETKLEAHKDGYLFPHARATVVDAQKRAGLSGSDELDLIELHDCFTITEYMLSEHFGLAEPGQAWRLLEEGTTAHSGSTPINPSGGLIGGGHPIGATGVRMILDGHKQVRNLAGDYQVDNARVVQTMNIGGSATTTISFVVTR